MKAVIEEILQYLFDGYLERGGSSVFPIGEITNKHGLKPNDLGKYLVSEDLVKNEQFHADDFYCSISMAGIAKINPDFIDNHLSTILSTLGVIGNDWTGIMEILGFEQKDFQIAHNLANYFEARDIIETQFTHNDVIIKLTLRGLELYQENKGTFLNP